MKSVVFCGSSKRMEQMKEWGVFLKENGVTSFIPQDYSNDPRWSGSESDQRQIASELTLDHFERIVKHDAIFIFNVEGYAGPSTTMEIGFAYGNGKEIYSMCHDTTEVCRDILFKNVCPTKEMLLNELRNV